MKEEGKKKINPRRESNSWLS